jgi:sugar O-acyltransferase (sialic acid O-acetyltransferase NeuD family)
MSSHPVVVYGASGHGKVVADVLLAGGVRVLGFVDDGYASRPASVLGLPVLGSFDALLSLVGGGTPCDVALGIGDNAARARVFERCATAGIRLRAAIHPRATVAQSAVISDGALVGAGAVVNPDAVVERGAIVNTHAVVEHDCRVGEFAHISPNATMGGASRVGAFAQLGTAAALLPLVHVGRGSIVGAGAVVVRPLPDGVVAVGVPARVLRTLRTN